MPISQFSKTVNETFIQLAHSWEKHILSFTPREVGVVINVSAGMVKVSGLPGIGFEELLKFPGGLFGIAYNIDEDEIGAILLGEDSLLNSGNI
jgi:F-type H+-transporting ATPase subunit alpha